MEDYWFDLELYFPLKILFDLQFAKNGTIQYHYLNFDTEWTPGWSLWELYFNKYHGKGVNLEVRRKSSWIAVENYFKELAKEFKIKFSSKPSKENLIDLSKRVSQLNSAKNPSGYYKMLEMKIKLKKNGQAYIEDQLRQYFKKYLNNDLRRGLDPNFLEVNFVRTEKQFDILKKHILKKIQTENPKDLLLSDEELAPYRTFSEQGKYKSYIDRKLRLLEPLGTLWLAGFININQFNFHDTNLPERPRVGCYWFSMNISIKEDLNHWTVESLKDNYGLTNDIRIKSPEERDYWYESKRLNFKMIDDRVVQADFANAKILSQTFDVFWTLWIENPKGEYTYNEIFDMYKKLFNLLNIPGDKIGDDRSNIMSKIIPTEIKKSQRLEWYCDRKRKVWIFKINSLNNKS